MQMFFSNSNKRFISKSAVLEQGTNKRMPSRKFIFVKKSAKNKIMAQAKTSVQTPLAASISGESPYTGKVFKSTQSMNSLLNAPKRKGGCGCGK